MVAKMLFCISEVESTTAAHYSDSLTKNVFLLLYDLYKNTL